MLDTEAALAVLNPGRLGCLGLDVYEREKGLSFEDRSHRPLAYHLFIRLLAQFNVVITAYHGFLTKEAPTRRMERCTN